MKETTHRMIAAACAAILMMAVKAACTPVYALQSFGNMHAIPTIDDYRSAVLIISVVTAAIIAAILTCLFYRRFAAEGICNGKQLKKITAVYCLFFILVIGLARACMKGLFLLTFVLGSVLLIVVLCML